MESLTFTQIGMFIGGLVVIGGLAVVIKVLFTRQPPLHREYVDRESYKEDQDRINAEFARQARGRKEHYEKIEGMGRDIASLQTETRTQGMQLSNLDTKIDRILERLPPKPTK